MDCTRAGPGELSLEAALDSPSSGEGRAAGTEKAVPVCPSSDGDAPLCVPGRKAKTEVISNNDGTFTVTYVPPTAGMYTLLLKYGDQTVPGFPAKVPVDPAVDTSRVKVFGPGVDGQGRVWSVTVRIRGSGTPSFLDSCPIG